MRRLSLFLTTFILVLGLCGYYLGNRIISGSALLGAHSIAVWTGVIAFLGLVLLGPLMSRVLPENFSGRFFIFRWLINMAMAILFALLFYIFIVDLSVFLLGFFVSSGQIRSFHEWSLVVTALLVIATFVIGSVQALAPQIYRVDVPVSNLPPEFVGFKIAQISDLHIGEMIGVKYVKSVVEKTNALAPDAIALTGDIIDGNPRLTGSVTEELAALKSTHGTFYVTGNHEYYWGVHKLLEQIHKTGAKILMNENVLIRRGEAQIAIAGVADISTNGGMIPGQSSNPARSVEGLPHDTIKILLAHQPVSYRDAVKTGISLQLSGHTHGGQFFPWSLVVRLFQHYNQGLIKHDDMWIYVNRGTATWGPRIRFGIPPEITLLTLLRA